MVKAIPGARLLRSLARAGKAQQKLFARLISASSPTVSKPAKRTVKKAGAKKPGVLEIRQHPRTAPATPPGKWTMARSSLPPQAGVKNDQRMSHWLYIPEQIPESAARHGWPLIVMLHGCHQSATQFACGSRMNQLAEQKGYAVLYPQQPLGVQAQRCWRWYKQSVQHGDGETAGLAALIDTICTQQGIDRRRIYACGISAGAGMAAILALNHPDLIAAVAMHSAPVFGVSRNAIDGLRVMRQGEALHAEIAIDRILERRAIQPMPAILIQGDDDTVVHPVNQLQLARQWLKLNGVSENTTMPRVIEKAASRSGGRNAHVIHDYLVGSKVILRVARIKGLGHAWSGGDATERFNSHAGPDASRMVIDFLSRHRR